MNRAVGPLQGEWRGRVAIITGSTQGLGEAIAHRLAQWGAGGITVVGRNAERGAAVRDALGVPALFVDADMGDVAAPARIVAETERAFGRIDGIVNSAATTERTGLDASPEKFDEMFHVNARAPLMLLNAARSLLGATRPDGTRGGAVVNVLSMNALCGAANLTVYSMTKGAMTTLTKNAAHQLRHERIRVNGINLGWAHTPAENQLKLKEDPAGPRWLEVAARPRRWDG